MDDVPEVLYHYTSFDAFRKIMESEIVRATHYSELNDTSEIIMAQEILARSLLETDDSSTHRNTIPSLLDQVARFGRGELDPFLFSLSVERDSLYQWRAYCPDGGIAIGFKGEDLAEHFRRESQSIEPWQLVPCEYHKPDATIDMQPIVANADRLFAHSSGAPEGLGQKVIDSLRAASSFSLLEERCCSIKHCAYASENEWRCFASSRRLTVQLDERHRRMVEMHFAASEVIKEVVISPHGDERRARILAEHLKDSKNLNYEITYSEIPFRT